MMNLTPMLACRGPILTTGQAATLLCLVLGWALGAVLTLVNIGFLLLTRSSKRFLLTNTGILLSYVGLAAWVLRLGAYMPWGEFSEKLFLSLVFVMPVFVIIHFAWLLFYRKRLKTRIEQQNQIPQPDRVGAN